MADRIIEIRQECHSVSNPDNAVQLLIILCRSSVPDEVPLMFEYESKKYILREDFYIQSNALPVKDELVPVSAVSERRFNSQNGESFLSYEVSHSVPRRLC